MATNWTTQKNWMNPQKHTVFQKLDKEELKNLNSLITGNKIESGTKKFSTNESPGPDGFTGKFYQALKKKELILTPLELLKKKKMEEKG